MRIKYIDVDMAHRFDIAPESSIYLNSRHLPAIGYYPFQADSEVGYVKCYTIDRDIKTFYGEVEIYVPNDEKRFPGIERIPLWAK